MCKSVQNQNQPSKTGCFAQPQKLDFNGIQCVILPNFIQTTILYDTPAQRAELDWLLYNKPLEYAQMVLRGEIEHYLSLGCDHGRLED